MTRLLLIVLILLPFLQKTNAQVTGLQVEIFQEHDGIAFPILAGYTTYRVYATVIDNDDLISLVFGNPVDPGAQCPQTVPFGITLNSGQIYQNGIGDCFPVNCNFQQFDPLLEFDSYLTLGFDCDDGGNYFVLDLFSDGVGFCNNFETGAPTLETVSGGYFTLNDFDNGYSSCSHKVLVAQFTTNGDWDYCASFQGQQCGTGGSNFTWCALDFCISSDDASFAYDDDFLIELTNGPLCSGQLGTIEITDILDDVVNAGISFELFEEGNAVAIDTGAGPYTGLGAGSYYVVGTSDPGVCSGEVCVYTSNTILIENTGLLNAVVDLEYPDVCDGLVDITVNIQGGAPPFSYSIDGTNFQVSNFFGQVACQDYTVTFEDDEGCPGTVPAEPVCSPDYSFNNLTADVDFCNSTGPGSLNGVVTGGAGTLTGQLTGPVTDTFTGASPLGISVDQLPAGNYTLTVSDIYNCQDQFDFQIDQPDIFEILLSITDAQCNDECSGEATVTITGGVSPIDIVWNGISGTTTNSQLCAGQNVVTVTDDEGCELEEIFVVGEPSAILLIAPTTSVSCNGLSDGSINANATGGTGLFMYNIGGADQASGDFTGLAAGPYTVTATDENGCPETIQVTVTQPQAIGLTGNVTNITCNGLNNGLANISATGGVGAGTYILNPGNVSQLNGLFSNLAPGSYTVTYTDLNDCVSEPFEFDITQPNALTVTIITIENITCGDGCDGSIFIEVTGGTGPFDSIWNGTAQTGIGDLCIGPNTLVVTDSNGCEITLNQDLTGPPPIIPNIIVDNTTCTGMCDGVVIVQASGGQGAITLSYTGPCQSGLTDLCEGFCTVTATDEAGCTITENISVLTDLVTDMELFTETSPVSCWNQQDGTATLIVTGGNPPLAYQWNDALEQTTATAIALPEESYEVTVTDEVGCTLTTSVEVEVTEGCFFIATVLTPNGDGQNDTWLIGGLDLFQGVVVQVINRWGQIVFESRGYTIPWDGRFNGDRLPVADYYYIIDYAPDEEPILGTVTIKY